MDKSSAQLGVNPVGKVSALSAVASVGSPAQSLESRASHLAMQQAALAAQMATANGMQKLVSTAHLSSTAHLIDQSLQQAEAGGVSQKYQAPAVLTQTPNLPAVVTEQLKAAISKSGLFYESHLHDFAEGHRSLAEMKQEPQNKPNYMMQTLLPQQLHILEQQRLSWHGEVWPNQQMDWDVYAGSKQHHEAKHAEDGDEESSSISSDLTLHLPHLGKVTAKISIQGGRMRIGFLAEKPEALQRLKAKSPALVGAIESHGQAIESLTLNTAMAMEHDG